MNKEEWLRTKFIVCPKCGYNNEKKRFSLYGKCLRCNEIIDKRIYFKRLIWEDKYEGRKDKKYSIH